MSRSIYVDSALHVVKGALVSVLRIPTGRTTTTVQNNATAKTATATGASTVTTHGGSITVASVAAFEKSQEKKIQEAVDEKVAENAPYHIYRMDRKEAEQLYGETMYDQFPVPDSVTSLRLCRLPGWNLNCQVNPVLQHTGLLGKVTLTKFTYNADKKTLKVTIDCVPIPGE
ncbi:unnamed protein product, partial [Amoebophrya sp. A25]|eukprot:GSA25T00026784001.1